MVVGVTGCCLGLFVVVCFSSCLFLVVGFDSCWLLVVVVVFVSSSIVCCVDFSLGLAPCLLWFVAVVDFSLVVFVIFSVVTVGLVVGGLSSVFVIGVVVSLVLLFVVLHLFSVFLVVFNQFISSCFCASFFLLFVFGFLGVFF